MDQKDFDRASILVGKLASYEKQFNKKNINENSILEDLEEILNKYNQKGRDLIFEKLERDADKSPSEIILANGKISDAALSEAISYAVNTANHIGIDIVNSQQTNIEKNKINTISEVAITAVAIKDMIKNYDNLTLEQKNTISDNLHLLSSEERMKYFKDKENRIDELDLGEDEKRAAKFLNKTNQDLEGQLAEILKAARGKEQDIIDMFMKEQPDFKKVLANFIKDGEKTPSEILTFLFTYVQGNIDKRETSIEEKQKEDPANSKAMYDNLISFVSSVKEVTGFEIEYDRETLGWYMEEFVTKVKKEQEVSEEEKKESYDVALSKAKDDLTVENNKKTEKSQTLNESIFQEIQQLPIALMKTNFSQEEITEALQIYKGTLESFEADDIELLSSGKIDAKKLLEKYLNEDGVSPEIAEILSKIDYNGQLFNILGDETRKQEFFEQLDQSISQEINSNESVELTGELKDIIEGFNQTHSIDNEQTFEENEPEQHESQSPSTFNQETIRDELAAIPVALSNIEGIDKADIISGMQGYKQLLDSIDASSLQGKSDEDVLKILMSKATDIGLEGNANEILLMMSQIGFSKDGTMQIADILTESKDVFTALVDEASKEENIDRAIQENQSQTLITDREAMPGMRLLIEDLSFAKENENQLGDQVVANDGNVSDTVSSSDTDAAQGTTSTGKLNLTSIENHVQNRRMSGITSQFELISEIIKNEQKDKNGQEQEQETDGPEVS